MTFLNKEGLERLWQHIVIKLGDKADKTEIEELKELPIEKGNKENSLEIAAGGITLSEGSIAGGQDEDGSLALAGCKGFFYLYHSDTDVYLSLAQGTEEWSDEAQALLNSWQGKKINIVGSHKHTMCSQVIAIMGNCIAVDKLPFGEQIPFDTTAPNTYEAVDWNTLTNPDWDDGAVYCPEAPEAGMVPFGRGARSIGANTQAIGTYSVAEGKQTLAANDFGHAEGRWTKAGYASHAEGYNTSAIGQGAHSEGHDTVASAHSSHAEGKGTTASGWASHAEGENTTVTGRASHVEGMSNTVHGNDSHAEGFENTVSSSASHAHVEGHGSSVEASASHAEGRNTHAQGYGSHTEGGGTYAKAEYAHAEGYQTYANGNNSHSEGDNTTASGKASHAEGMSNTVSGQAAHVEGLNNSVSGGDSHAEGMSNTITSEGSHAHAEGARNTVSGNSAHAEGDGNTVSGKAAHAEGLNNTASGQGSHAEGGKSNATGLYSHAEGESTASGINSHSEGIYTKAVGDYSHIEGLNNAQAEGAVGIASHVEGANGTAKGNYSHVEGLSNKTGSGASGAHAEGEATEANAKYAHTEGWHTTTSELAGHVQGKYNATTSGYAHVVGNGTSDSDRKDAHRLDWDGNAWFAGDVSIGVNSKKLATEEFVNTQLDNYKTIIDVDELPTSNIKENSLYRLFTATFVYNQLSYNQWNCNVVNSLPTAGDVVLIGDLSNPQSVKVNAYYNKSDNSVYGYVDSSLGPAFGLPADWYPFDTLIAKAGYNFAGVIKNISEDPSDNKFRLLLDYILYYRENNSWITIDPIGQKGTGASAEVFNHPTNIASGDASHAEGIGTKATAFAAHAEGYHTEANGSRSHTEGTETIANEKDAHAEGSTTIASGVSSHAEGEDTEAIGAQSHAEGKHTRTYADASHAEGIETQTGTENEHDEPNTDLHSRGAHAEGCYTTAKARGAHAEGNHTVAASSYQHVQGKANIIDTENKYAHIVGNGECNTTNVTSRSNAHTLDWNGNAWFAGDVSVGANSKKLATEEFVNEKVASAGGASGCPIKSGSGENTAILGTASGVEACGRNGATIGGSSFKSTSSTYYKSITLNGKVATYTGTASVSYWKVGERVVFTNSYISTSNGGPYSPLGEGTITAIDTTAKTFTFDVTPPTGTTYVMLAAGNKNTHINSTVIGSGLTSVGNDSLVVGKNNTTRSNGLFVVGCGANNSSKANGFEVYQSSLGSSYAYGLIESGMYVKSVNDNNLLQTAASVTNKIENFYNNNIKDKLDSTISGIKLKEISNGSMIDPYKDITLHIDSERNNYDDEYVYGPIYIDNNEIYSSYYFSLIEGDNVFNPAEIFYSEFGYEPSNPCYFSWNLYSDYGNNIEITAYSADGKISANELVTYPTVNNREKVYIDWNDLANGPISITKDMVENGIFIEGEIEGTLYLEPVVIRDNYTDSEYSGGSITITNANKTQSILNLSSYPSETDLQFSTAQYGYAIPSLTGPGSVVSGPIKYYYYAGSQNTYSKSVPVTLEIEWEDPSLETSTFTLLGVE